MSESLIYAIFSSVGTGLVTYGAMHMELRWLRRDVDYLLEKIGRVEAALIAKGINLLS